MATDTPSSIENPLCSCEGPRGLFTPRKSRASRRIHVASSASCPSVCLRWQQEASLASDATHVSCYYYLYSQLLWVLRSGWGYVSSTDDGTRYKEWSVEARNNNLEVDEALSDT